MATYYGSYQGIVDEFDGTLPSSHWNQAAIEARLLPTISAIIDSELAAYYIVPFYDVVKHVLGIPPIITDLANSVAKVRIMTGTDQDKSPRRSSSYEIMVKMVREQFKRIKLAAGDDYQELVYSDGTVVTRKTSKPLKAGQMNSEQLLQHWTEIDDDGYDSNTYYDKDA